MNEPDASIDSLLADRGLRRSPAAWQDDLILTRLLAPLGDRAVAVSSLANPLRLLSAPAGGAIAFDYAYFMFLRDLCRSLTLEGATHGALLALYHFEVGRALDEVGLGREGAGLLRSACELRSSFAVHLASSIAEASLSQIVLNACMAHERAHSLFAEDEQARDDWANEARAFLMHLRQNAPRMYPDRLVLDDILASADIFLTNDALIEEIACDFCAVESCIDEAAEQRPASVERYCDAYYAALRLNMLALFIARTLSDAAALIVKETREGRLQSIANPDSVADLSFMSGLRLRFQALLLKVVSLKARHVPIEIGFRATADVLSTQETVFQKIAANLMTELHEARRSIGIHRQIWIGHASRTFFGETREPDNLPLISLFQRQFWFPPMDLYSD